MFKPEQKNDGNMPETFIGPQVRVQGDFSGEGNVRVEGSVVGNLHTKGDVTVGQQAVIEAELKAHNALVAGKVKGNLTVTQSLTLQATANVLGDIKAVSLIVEEGAVINGRIVMSKEKAEKSFAENPKPQTDFKLPVEEQSLPAFNAKEKVRTFRRS